MNYLGQVDPRTAALRPGNHLLDLLRVSVVLVDRGLDAPRVARARDALVRGGRSVRYDYRPRLPDAFVVGAVGARHATRGAAPGGRERSRSTPPRPRWSRADCRACRRARTPGPAGSVVDDPVADELGRRRRHRRARRHARRQPGVVPGVDGHRRRPRRAGRCASTGSCRACPSAPAATTSPCATGPRASGWGRRCRRRRWPVSWAGGWWTAAARRRPGGRSCGGGRRRRVTRVATSASARSSRSPALSP